MRRSSAWWVALGLAAAASLLAAAEGVLRARDVTHDEARPVIGAAGVSAPEAITRLTGTARAAAWPRWVAQRRATLRARLLRGEEDSLVPLLLFGTSFTSAPRITRAFLDEAARAAAAQGTGAAGVERALATAFEPRVDALLRALAAPGDDERLTWARDTLVRLGHRLDTPDGRAKAGQYLVQNFARATRESGELSAALGAAGAAGGDPPADRARLFAQRGLAPDTSWPIGFAVAEALGTLATSGAVPPGSIRHVAIVGPGLDFADKDEGYDYYPPQTLQPFDVVDALVGLRLASRETVRVTTLDVSPRVNEHVRRLATRPATRPYDLQLARRQDVPWTAAAVRYFAEVGRHVGTPVSPVQAPASSDALETRAIRVARDVLKRITAVELDVVHQRLPLAPDSRFDLVVATNVLLYYDRFEQGLAAAAIAGLLRPGGFLLTNTRLDDVPAFPFRRVAGATHVFSNRPGDGEVVIAYGR
jgi:SAM-dependent methyltransferase